MNTLIALGWGLAIPERPAIWLEGWGFGLHDIKSILWEEMKVGGSVQSHNLINYAYIIKPNKTQSLGILPGWLYTLICQEGDSSCFPREWTW